MPRAPPVTSATLSLSFTVVSSLASAADWSPVFPSRLVRQIVGQSRSHPARPERRERIGEGADVVRIARQIAEDVAQLEERHRCAARRLRRLLQLLPAWVVRRDRLAALSLAVAIAAPESRHERETPERPACLQPIADGGKNELRLTVRAVKTETLNGVADLRIGEAARNQFAIAVETGVGWRRNNRLDLALGQLFEERADLLVCHRLVNEMDVKQPRWISNRRVTAVEDTDLHQFVRRHVGGESDTDLLQTGQRGRGVSTTHS